MPLIQHATNATFPNIAIFDLVAMFRRDGHAAMLEQGRAFGGPGFEFFAVRVVFDAGDHEVCEMAVFVCEDVEEAVGGVDYF